MQEAHEKANEIMIKTEHDFNLEKQTLVQQGKGKVNEELRQMVRNHEVEQRIARSNMITSARTQKMESRDTLLQQLKNDAYARVNAEASKPSYPSLLKDLTLQGLLTLENERNVQVVCRKEDLTLVKGHISSVAKDYTKRKGGASIKISISPNNLPSQIIPGEPSGPGVVVTAQGGRVVCDNTLATRLSSVVYDKTPELRASLFPSDTIKSN